MSVLETPSLITRFDHLTAVDALAISGETAS
jgi:hypothetical protein